MMACAALRGLEVMWPNSPLLRICAVFLQGAWFIGAGVILYGDESRGVSWDGPLDFRGFRT